MPERTREMTTPEQTKETKDFMQELKDAEKNVAEKIIDANLWDLQKKFATQQERAKFKDAVVSDLKTDGTNQYLWKFMQSKEFSHNSYLNVLSYVISARTKSGVSELIYKANQEKKLDLNPNSARFQKIFKLINQTRGYGTLEKYKPYLDPARMSKMLTLLRDKTFTTSPDGSIKIMDNNNQEVTITPDEQVVLSNYAFYEVNPYDIFRDYLITKTQEKAPTEMKAPEDDDERPTGATATTEEEKQRQSSDLSTLQTEKKGKPQPPISRADIKELLLIKDEALRKMGKHVKRKIKAEKELDAIIDEGMKGTREILEIIIKAPAAPSEGEKFTKVYELAEERNKNTPWMFDYIKKFKDDKELPIISFQNKNYTINELKNMITDRYANNRKHVDLNLPEYKKLNITQAEKAKLIDMLRQNRNARFDSYGRQHQLEADFIEQSIREIRKEK